MIAATQTRNLGRVAVRSVRWLVSDCVKAAASGDGVASQRSRGRDYAPRLLDLFCCAGGAGEGYRRAGFDVTGVDIRPQPNNPHKFIQGDALEYLREHGHEYDAIHASPPCQAHSDLKHMWNAKKHADLIGPTRELLKAIGKPWIIENVEGAPLLTPIMLCGTMFGLGAEGAELRRHRLFEISWGFLLPPCCNHSKPRVIGVYGGHGRDRRRVQNTQDFSTEARREAMGIDWMTGAELSQAIPPDYTQWLGEKMLEFVPAVGDATATVRAHDRGSRNTTAQETNGGDKP